jgi:hypothetical protein
MTPAVSRRNTTLRKAREIGLFDWLLVSFREVQITEHGVRTVLRARFPDQGALYGFLHRLRAFGLRGPRGPPGG